LILLKIDRDGAIPIYQQIINQIIKLIENDIMESGSKLPASRVLAKKMGIDRSTVYRAYQELNALGHTRSHPGSYTRVRKRPRVSINLPPAKKSIISWADKSNEASQKLFQFFLKFSPESAPGLPSNSINLSPLDLDHRIFPVEDFRRCINQILVNVGEKILSYGDHTGYLPLREDIARRLQIHGISISPDEILITNGAQQAIELIFRLFLKPGTKVMIESPTYANIIPLLRYYRADILGIPLKKDGLDLDYLRSQLKKEKPAFLYTIPNFQNPTGITTNQAHREKLLALCENQYLPIVEDGFEEEMKYFGKVVLPIKSMDQNKLVIYLGTFSKVLFPGIRVGWITADRECIRRLTAIKRFTDLSGSTFVQAAISTFLRNGYYDLHLKRMHRIFRKRMQVAFHALEKYFPKAVTWTRPEGGYTIWVNLPACYADEESFKNSLLKFGVLVSPGEYYFHMKNNRQFFRISIASLNEDEIEEGICRLGKALDHFKLREV
jgi:GntR family transcriptional regulator/MocR family aminotransferase